MAKGKSPKCDGVVESYVKFCHGIGREYTKIIHGHVVSKGRFPRGVNKIFITFILKARKKERILVIGIRSLFGTPPTRFMQRCLQPLLLEVITNSHCFRNLQVHL
jgi:hypothetical protein